MTEWISVENSKPPEHQWMLLGSSTYQLVTFGIFLDGKFVNPDLNYHEIQHVTHYMPFPPPPNEEASQKYVK